MSGNGGWIGVDLDGTLAHYDRWRGAEHIGDPVPEMLERVRAWVRTGQEVRVFTARVWSDRTTRGDHAASNARRYIKDWLYKHLGYELRITCEKDFGMIELWDDRCVRVRPNTGAPCCGAE